MQNESSQTVMDLTMHFDKQQQASISLQDITSHSRFNEQNAQDNICNRPNIHRFNLSQSHNHNINREPYNPYFLSTQDSINRDEK